MFSRDEHNMKNNRSRKAKRSSLPHNGIEGLRRRAAFRDGPQDNFAVDKQHDAMSEACSRPLNPPKIPEQCNNLFNIDVIL